MPLLLYLNHGLNTVGKRHKLGWVTMVDVQHSYWLDDGLALLASLVGKIVFFHESMNMFEHVPNLAW